MKNTTTKKRTGFIAAMLAAILLCMLAVICLSNTAPKVHASTAEEENLKIGISFPADKEYYDKKLDYYKDYFEAKDYTVIPTRCSNIYVQISDIKRLAECVDVLVIAPMAMDRYSMAEFITALNYADSLKVKIIIYGNIISNCPTGTMFIIDDYYQLGIQHAQSIISTNPNLNKNSLIYVFYFKNDDGFAYYQGVVNGLNQFGYLGKVKEEIIGDVQEVIDAVEVILDTGIDVAEMTTYNMETAELILQCFYNHGYDDAPLGSGTGIRVLPLEEEDEEAWNDYFNKEAQLLNEMIEALLSGADHLDVLTVDGYYVVYNNNFIPGRVQYVE